MRSERKIGSLPQVVKAWASTQEPISTRLGSTWAFGEEIGTHEPFGRVVTPGRQAPGRFPTKDAKAMKGVRSPGPRVYRWLSRWIT